MEQKEECHRKTNESVKVFQTIPLPTRSFILRDEVNINVPNLRSTLGIFFKYNKNNLLVHGHLVLKQ